ncbi:hypothetical protein [Streptomyces sp. YIM S03343]
MRTTTLLAVTLLLAGAAVGCSPERRDTAKASLPAETVTPSTEPATSASATSGSDKVFPLTHTVTYDHGVKLGLSGFSRGVSSDVASPANTPYVKFTVKVTNGSSGTVDTTVMSVNCSYGEDGQQSESIFDDGLNGAPQTRLLAGRSLSVPWACELPKGERVLQVEVTPDLESATAIFTGEVK